MSSAPCNAATAMDVARTWSPSISATLINFCTTSTVGAFAVERLSPGGVARAAGLDVMSHHLTARPRAACSKR
jgi:hypothetical protein